MLIGSYFRDPNILVTLPTIWVWPIFWVTRSMPDVILFQRFLSFLLERGGSPKRLQISFCENHWTFWTFPCGRTENRLVLKGAHYVYTNTCSCPPRFLKLTEKLSSRAFQWYMTLLYIAPYTTQVCHTLLESSRRVLYNADAKNRVPLILGNGRPWCCCIKVKYWRIVAYRRKAHDLCIQNDIYIFRTPEFTKSWQSPIFTVFAKQYFFGEYDYLRVY